MISLIECSVTAHTCNTHKINIRPIILHPVDFFLVFIAVVHPNGEMLKFKSREYRYERLFDSIP